MPAPLPRPSSCSHASACETRGLVNRLAGRGCEAQSCSSYALSPGRHRGRDSCLRSLVEAWGVAEYPVKVNVDAKALPPGSGRGNLSSRLVFAGERWQSRDLCIHGQELKWHCAECDEYFKGREKPKRKKKGRPSP